MQTLAESSKALSTEELKQFGKQTGPLVTILAAHTGSRLKKLAHEAERKLAERGYDEGAASALMQPLLAQIAKIGEESGTAGEGVALFATPGETHVYRLPRAQEETVAIGENFFVRPLIPFLNRDKEFYILAVAQKHTRLLKCTESTSEEVPLPKDTPATLHQDMQTDQPDHNQENRVSPGPSQGTTGGVMFGTGTFKEDRDKYLAQWFKDLSRGVGHVLHDSSAPLVLCCVDYEQALYRVENSYPHLIEEGITGAPDGFKGGEMHKRALEAMERHCDQKVEEALKRWNKQNGDAAKAGVKEIVKASYEGRVLTLFVAESAQVMGSFNEATFSAEGSKESTPFDEDLLNAAAMQTMLHGGHVFVVAQSRIPENRPLAAIMRY